MCSYKVLVSVMELQQHFPVSVNDYEENEGNAEKREKNDAFKTEDLYQSLQFPPTAHHGTTDSTTLLSKRCERKYVFLLFAVNAFISAIILVIVGLNYSHNRETQPIKGQKELWLLHDNVFYLFWSKQSDCGSAESFCSERNASLAILTEHNKAWLMSRTNGKQFLVLRASSDGSGGTASAPVDDEDCDCVMTSV
ncbi:uncharacterized protein LOC122344888 isoform X2 [Puntigrus tetrazona]|uniref:uncharacterized protein LOC122344888 isoform X2 n=1 Tax=Puntigrus tetrazona TaxID=1606681 RepID=UPI001C88F71C|nr:uncharacterized protein LOC122344888 isoform X2 [Puntigrus tetrazona]